MSDRHSRRRFLRTAAPLALLGLAGCTAGADGDGENETSTTTTAPNGTPANATTGTNETANATADANGSANATKQPYGLKEVHYHGTLVLEVNGTEYGFGQRPKFYEKNTGNKFFHYHNYDSKWHVHGRGVTLAYAAESMPDFSLSADSVTYEGHSYDATASGTTIEITADGIPVDPNTYVLQADDEIVVSVETDKQAPPQPTTTPAPNSTASNGNTTNGNATGGNTTGGSTTGGNTTTSGGDDGGWNG